MHAPSTPDQQAPFLHLGGTGAMVRMALANLALNVLTLSLWRFWGKTRVRRALWAGTSAWGDTAEYVGTGRELFLGFVLVLLLVFLPLAGAFAVVQGLAEAGHPLAGVAFAALQALVLFLGAAGLYRARRYQLSRTVWRGIRGNQSGAAWRYGLLFLGVGLATVATLGWAWPWAELVLARYRLNNTAFGDCRFRCDATARPLYKRFAVLWGCAALFASALPMGAVLLVFANDHTTPAQMALSVGAFYLLLVVWGLLTIALPYAWYRAGFYRQMAAHTRFADTGFALEASTGGLVRLALGNGLISLLSLGVLRPWAALRTFRYVCTHLRVDGEPDWERIRQSAAPAPRSGEGLAAVFDGAGGF
ncbi:MAG: YjgN family protein [Magnetospirillum sp.]|nr:YjgN family protein [Magnetospirillum sp.]